MQYTEEEQQQITKFKKALDKAKVALVRTPKWAFFTAVCFSLKQKVDFSIPTAATDGLSIYYNPAFFLGLPAAQQIGVVIHETLHVAYLHMDRAFSLDMDVFNQAADHVINLQIIKHGFQLPEWVLKDERFEGMSTEQVYKILIQENKNNPSGGQPNPMGGDLLPAPKGETKESIKKKVEQILVQAVIRAKQEKAPPGSIPGDLGIEIDKLLNPKLPWQRILQRYVKAQAKEDYSWRRPNRRYFPDKILPSLFSERLIDLAIAVDTSGSVSDHEFRHMVSEICSIFKMMKPEKITLLQFDTKLHTETRIKSIRELLACKFTGRGETRVEPIMDWAEKHKPQVMLVFTDGGFRIPQGYTKQTESRTLWLIHNEPNYTAPFGKTVHYEIGYDYSTH